MRQQVKKLKGGLVFAPPKRGKLRDVPLDPEVSAALTEHMETFPPVKVTLPVADAGRAEGNASADLHERDRYGAVEQQLQRSDVEACVGLRRPHPGAGEGKAVRGRPRTRHARVAALLRLGPPGRRGERQGAEPVPRPQRPGFTLRVYTHLMPSSETRTRKAISAMYRAAGHAHDGPDTAQAA